MKAIRLEKPGAYASVEIPGQIFSELAILT